MPDDVDDCSNGEPWVLHQRQIAEWRGNGANNKKSPKTAKTTPNEWILNRDAHTLDGKCENKSI